MGFVLQISRPCCTPVCVTMAVAVRTRVINPRTTNTSAESGLVDGGQSGKQIDEDEREDPSHQGQNLEYGRTASLAKGPTLGTQTLDRLDVGRI